MLRETNHKEQGAQPYEAGQQFGAIMAGMLAANRVFSVTVDRVDVEANVAYVRIFENDEALSVPLSFTPLQDGAISAIPRPDTLALVAFTNGNENAPFFVAFESIDGLRLSTGSVNIEVNVDTEDSSKDSAKVQVGESSAEITSDAVTFISGESSINVSNDTVDFNGGNLGTLVVAEKLVSTINKLVQEINVLKQQINLHSHASFGTPPVPLMSATLSTVKLDDFANEKIKQ